MTIAAPEPKANMGQPIPRYDAVAKVTGRAEYAADVPLVRPVFACLVTSAIAKGRIDSFDLDSAKQVRGVIDIVTHENAEKLKEATLFSNGGYAATTIQPLKSPEIAQHGQIVAVVLAENLKPRARRRTGSRSTTRRIPPPPRSALRERPPQARRGSSPNSQKTRRSATSPAPSMQPTSSSPLRMRPRPNTTIRWSCLRQAVSGRVTG